MALISCPECGKQISETTPSCPHCGYALSSAPAQPQAPVPTPTKIGDVQTNYGLGVTLIVIGIIGLIGSVIFLIVFLILGIFALVGSVAILGVGIQKITGTQDVYCPHCGKLSQLGKTAQNFKCPVCKKLSVRDGEYLKPIM
ncbi:zinc-ribbon domain-containing protein [Pseudoflavonifractor sp. BIOML-A6]|jgi:hypothetical protein|nr:MULTISPECIES: zinc ribbon domain-containing protein [unclassified Pseudoflavonifractor]MTQ98621.1 zinc-ribbon domain-containing protein [Pseudoflavonifractor sp. BIOML-A16]MTR07919.1 zinc-ribbon domain-containing protein [Pseudoflavonifractor sp. BIOML-A15]MTR34086.1 zinc-ribbon domain-containing protein [Pseudoflavonifractor sp. BIOML-A14]MTR74856.1 zinc-ribbon domain-containing protein [Pseudoflavonifractor sp. BIOML-A18]MTS66083.1 zinc-ribbon domain-containing protein [Pseudoflavonifract